MNTTIIDVRTRREFLDGSVHGAINIPSENFRIDEIERYRANHLALVCESGRRAEGVLRKLEENGFTNTSLLDVQLSYNIDNTDRWSIDRQFRLVLSVFLGIFIIGFILEYTVLIALPIIIFGGLLFSAITDNCYLKILISKMPWNN